VYYQYKVEASIDGVAWKVIVDRSKNAADLPHDCFELQAPVDALLVRITNVNCPDPIVFSLFGSQKKDPPEAPTQFTVTRHPDVRTVKLTWKPAPDAIGYNIRYGVAKDKEYLNYQIYGRSQNALEIRLLNKNLKYSFSIDVFNEGGITDGKDIIPTQMPS
jgi:hypothetical protein